MVVAEETEEDEGTKNNVLCDILDVSWRGEEIGSGRGEEYGFVGEEDRFFTRGRGVKEVGGVENVQREGLERGGEAREGVAREEVVAREEAMGGEEAEEERGKH